MDPNDPFEKAYQQAISEEQARRKSAGDKKVAREERLTHIGDAVCEALMPLVDDSSFFLKPAVKSGGAVRYMEKPDSPNYMATVTYNGLRNIVVTMAVRIELQPGAPEKFIDRSELTVSKRDASNPNLGQSVGKFEAGGQWKDFDALVSPEGNVSVNRESIRAAIVKGVAAAGKRFAEDEGIQIPF